LWQNYISKPLTTADEYTTVSISPSSRQIAFTRDKALLVINMDGTDERVLVNREDMNALFDESMKYFYYCDWMNETYLVFYTFVDGEIGRSSRNDLYLVNVQTGEWQTIFAPGTGGMVYVSPDGVHIAVVSQTSIRLMHYDGSNQRTVLTYEHVLYATDVPWYPNMVWSADSRSLIVSVSSANAPNNPLEPATIWRIPVEGTPTIIAQTTRDLNPLFSPDFSQYVALSNTYGLYVFDINGANEQLYTDSHVYWMDWLPDSSGFVYYDGTIMVGRVGEPPLPLSTVDIPGDISWPRIAWIDPIHYILHLEMISTDHQQFWTDLWFGTVGGVAIPVIKMDRLADKESFDFVRE